MAFLRGGGEGGLFGIAPRAPKWGGPQSEGGPNVRVGSKMQNLAIAATEQAKSLKSSGPKMVKGPKIVKGPKVWGLLKAPNLFYVIYFAYINN